MRPRDAFIPPQPARPEDAQKAREAGRADAFAEAALANAGGREAGKTKPKPSLFSRMTGLGLGPARDEPPRPQKPAEPTLLKRPDGKTPEEAVREERTAEPAAGAQQAAPAEDLAPTRAEEEMLEIPAFLRRQAN